MARFQLLVAVAALAGMCAATPRCVMELVGKSVPPLITPVDNTARFSDYHVISFGGFSAGTGDVQGRLAVAGSATFGGGWSVGDQLQTAIRPPIDRAVRDSLIVGGSLVWGSGSLHPDGTGNPYPGAAEGMFISGPLTAPPYLAERREGASCDGCLNQYFDDAKDYYVALTQKFAAATANVAFTTQYGGVFLTGLVGRSSESTRYYVTIPATTFSSTTWWTATNVNIQGEIIVTISGSEDVYFRGGQFVGIPERVVFNIPGSRNVYVETEVTGSIVAPEATLIQTGGVIVGYVIAGDVHNVLQVNKLTCGGCDCCDICEESGHPARATLL